MHNCFNNKYIINIINLYKCFILISIHVFMSTQGQSNELHNVVHIVHNKADLKERKTIQFTFIVIYLRIAFREHRIFDTIFSRMFFFLHLFQVIPLFFVIRYVAFNYNLNDYYSKAAYTQRKFNIVLVVLFSFVLLLVGFSIYKLWESYRLPHYQGLKPSQVNYSTENCWYTYILICI